MMTISETLPETYSPLFRNFSLLQNSLKDNIHPTGSSGTILEKLSNKYENIISKTDSDLSDEEFLLFELNKKLSKLESFGIDWHDEDIPVGPTREIILLAKKLIPGFIEHSLVPNRITPSIEEGLCFVFRKDNINAYLELYNDGDIALIAEDFKDKIVIFNEQVKADNIFNKLKKILS